MEAIKVDQRLSISPTNFEFLRQIGSHYSNIKVFQNLVKNLKVFNTITPTMISDFVNSSTEHLDAATAL